LTKIFKSNNKIFYLTDKSPVCESGGFDVILSPQFYWVKKVELPVKRVSQALSLAESVYANSLPEGDFAFEASKSGDEFVIIAYDKEKIFQVLKEKFIKNAKVSGVYFAQNEFSELDGCCGIDQNSSLINLNGLVLQVPRVCTDSKKEISQYLENKKLSRNKVTLGAFESSVVDAKEFYLLAAGVVILFASFVMDTINYKSEINSLEKQKQELVSKYDLPQTSIQLASIKKSLTKTFTTQKKIRDAVYGANGVGLKKGEFIESIKANSKETVIVIKVSSSNREQEIKRELSKTVDVKSTNIENNNLTIRIGA